MKKLGYIIIFILISFIAFVQIIKIVDKYDQYRINEAHEKIGDWK